MLVLVALVPLAVGGDTLFPYVVGKTVLLWGMIFVVSAVFAYVFIADRTFKTEVTARLRSLWKRPVVKMVALSWVLLALSTLFAYDRSMAIFGTVERGEGFLGLTSFYLFFLYTAVLFKKKEWNRFFWVSILSGWAVFFYALVQALQGMARPYSFLGNPIYVAVYFLFTLAISLLLVRESAKFTFARVAAVSTAVMSVVGIFITESRGVLLGMAIALVIALCAFAFFRRFERGEKKKVQKVFVGVIVFLVAFGGLFLATRQKAVWQEVPGLNRIAAYSLKDGNTQARIINTQMSLTALNPKNESVKTMLLGWGWDNYLFAWQKYYNPALYGYDTGVFDRPHDKILDTLVMTGLLGFLAYIAVWFFFLREIVRCGKRSPYAGAVLIFWAVAYFLQNLTAFDTVVTFIIFFAVIAYVTSLNDDHHTETVVVAHTGMTASLAAGFIALAVFSGISFFAWALIPSFQMSRYAKAMEQEFVAPSQILNDEFIFTPATYSAQGAIRQNMLTLVLQEYDEGKFKGPSPVLDLALKKMEEYSSQHPDEYEFVMLIAKGYDAEANLTNNPALFKTAETYYDKARVLMPDRQEGVYLLAINLFNQGRIDEGLAVLQHAEDLNPEIASTHFELAQAYSALGKSYYDKSLAEFEFALSKGVNLDPAITKKSYENFFSYYYHKGDFADSLTAVRRLVTLDPAQTVYPQLVAYMEKNQTLPKIDFGS